MRLGSTEKTRDLLKLLTMNQDHLCYELTSLAAKVNNFLDDRTRMLSGQLISVMYESIMEEDADDSVETDACETVGIDANDTVEIDDIDVPGEASLSVDDSYFALVQ